MSICRSLVAVLTCTLLVLWLNPADAGHRSGGVVRATAVSGSSHGLKPITCTLEDTLLSFEKSDDTVTIPPDKTSALKLEKKAVRAAVSIPAEGTVGRFLCGISPETRKEIPMTSGEILDGVLDTDDLGSFQFFVTMKNRSTMAGLAVHLVLADQKYLRDYLAKPEDVDESRQIELVPTSHIVCTIASPGLYIHSADYNVTFSENDAKDLALDAVADTERSDGSMIEGLVDSLSCRDTNNGRKVAVTLASRVVDRGLIRTAEFGEIRASFLVDALAIRLGMKAENAAHLAARLADANANAPGRQLSMGEDFQLLDPKILTCSVPGMSIKIESDGAVVVKGNLDKLVCRAASSSMSVDIPVVSRKAPGLLETKEFGSVQMNFSPKDFSLQYLMKQSDQNRLLAFLQSREDVPKAADVLTPLDPAKLACPIPKITLWTTSGDEGIYGRIEELRCHLPSAPDIPVELSTKSIVKGTIVTRDFGTVRLIGLNLDAGSLSLAMKAADLPHLLQYLREYGIASISPLPRTDEAYEPPDPARFSCHAVMPNVVIEAGIVVGGTVDQLLCSIPYSEEKRIELVSSEIIDGVIRTKNFGGVKFVGTFLIDSGSAASTVSFAMTPADATKMEKYLKTEQQ